MYTIIETKTKFEKKAGTKNAYKEVSKEVSKEVNEVTEDQHRLSTNDDTVKWFRRLGGSETVTREYTYVGYVVTKLVSTSPDKEHKTVREYQFKK